MDTEPSTLRRLRELRVDALYGKKKHANAADRKYTWSRNLGLAAVILNIVIGSTLVVLLENEFPENLKWIGAILALIAGLATGLQTFLDLPGKVEGHRDASAEYLVVKNEADRIIAGYGDGVINLDALHRELSELQEQYNRITRGARPFHTNSKDYQRARSGIESGEESYARSEMGG
ncbi:MAG TPA: SLATT domain-containing protein [Thiohalobacter sp.]|nr:SLATT domain-containing protein [Thiohalobacter sp.]